MINPVIFFRKPSKCQNSIEELFSNLISEFSAEVNPVINIMPFRNNGFIRKLLNLCVSPFYQGQINHITGDIHYIALFLKKQKTILTIHDLEIINRNHGLKKRLLLLFWFWLPCRRVEIITVISSFTKSELLKYTHIEPSKIRIIPNCVSGKIHYVSRDFNDKCPLILQVGTKKNKNLETLIMAISEIRCHLLILGKLEIKQMELLEQYGIRYEVQTGISYDKVLELYIRCDLLAYVSTYEGFGLPILEAQATGRPVITSKIASMPEVAGEGALLVDPLNYQEIRNGILRLCKDKIFREQVIQKGLENVQRFNSDVIAMQYLTLYNEIYDANLKH